MKGANNSRNRKADSLSRRRFLKFTAAGAIGALGFPYLLRSSALGKAGAVAPSNRITIGCIGLGWQGPGNMKDFLNQPDTCVAAVCDVDHVHLENAQNTVNKHYGNQDCAAYTDFREVIARDDIDAVSLALPDHWHSVPAIMAAKSGKDIYGEKPFAHSLKEGRAMCDAVKRYGRVWQTGSWQRSQGNFRQACEIVLNGCIGKVHTVEVGLPGKFYERKDETIKEPPEELNYERWLGPAPWAPYCEARVHVNWRWQLDYGGGQLTDWIGHHGDIAHWGLGLDYTAPVEIEGYGEYARDGLWNAATRYRLTSKYANGIRMIIAGGHDDIRGGTKWIGEDGWVWVDRGGLDAHPKNLLDVKFGPDEINLYRSPGHIRNFLDCVKSRATTLTPAEIAHRSVTPGHLGQIAMILGRKIRFDPQTEEIIADDTASSMLGKAMRSPWHL